MEATFDIKRVQNRLLQMAKTTADILEKHNIPYQIAFGTLLGAVRHGGFIPWDDDFDFLLFDDSYEKATEVLAKELPADLMVEDEKTEPKYFHAWAHVKDLKSECECSLFPQDAEYKNHGLSVDLYKLTKIKEKDFAAYRLDQAMSYIDRRKKLGFITEEDYEKKKGNIPARVQGTRSQGTSEQFLGKRNSRLPVYLRQARAQRCIPAEKI